MDATTGTTQLGSPHAGSWDTDWTQVVEAQETRMQRRICGARGYGGKACLMEPASANGRCRFHGGFAGAPKGNRNALRHGLYARRLQVCGPTCAAYESCPVAVTQAERLLLPEPPICPFETEELKDALHDAGVPVDEETIYQAWHGPPSPDGRDALPRVRRGGSPTRPADPDRGLGYEVALLRVMLGRAAVAIAHHGLADETVATGREYEMRYRKSSAYLDAFTRLTREYRLLHRMQSVEREEAANNEAQAWFANALRPPPDEDDELDEEETEIVEEVEVAEDEDIENIEEVEPTDGA